MSEDEVMRKNKKECKVCGAILNLNFENKNE